MQHQDATPRKAGFEGVGLSLAKRSIRYRWLILLSTALIVLVSGLFAFRVHYEMSPDIWFLDSDPGVVAYQQFKDLFGSDNVLIITCEAPPEDSGAGSGDGGTSSGNHRAGAKGPVFRNETLQSIERLSHALETLPLIARVSSLTRHQIIRGVGDDLIIEVPLRHPPLAEDKLREAEAALLSDRHSDLVVRDGGRVAVIVAETEILPAEIEARVELVRQIREVLSREADQSGHTFQLLGQAVLDDDLFRKTGHDMRFAIPLVFAVIGLFLAVTLRGWTGLLLPLILAGSVVILTRMVQYGLGWKDNSLVGLVPVILLVVSIADSVHIVIHYLTLRGRGSTGPVAAEESVRVLFLPCLLTSFTTAIGFLTLMTAPLAPLRQLGTLAAAGTGIAFLLTVVVLPAALSLLPGDFSVYRTRLENGALSRFVRNVPAWADRHHRLIPWVTIGVTLLGSVGLFRLSVESNFLDIFRRNDPMRLTTEAVENTAGGLLSLEILVSGATDGAVLRPEVLRAMAGLGPFLESEPMSTSVHSVADYLSDVNRAMHGDDPAFEHVPDEASLATQYLLLLEASASDVAIERMLDLPRRHARISVRTRFGSSSEYEHLQTRIADYAREHFPRDITVEQTGYVILYKNMETYVVRSQVRSFLLALSAIIVIMMITFRSWKTGLFSLIPNVWPILLTFGIMGWIGISLNPATAMVAAVVLGLAVDDTIHFLHKFTEGSRRGWAASEALDHAFSISGRAVVSTTVILLSGFFVISQCTLKLFAEFGTLCMMAVFLALIADLVVLPAMLLRFGGGAGARR